jgi:hypothetical protein
VFYDRDNDSYYNPPQSPPRLTDDTRVAGVIIRAFDSTGALVGTTTSSASSAYSLSITNAATNDIRVEFEIPSTDPTLDGFVPSLTNNWPSDATYGQSFGNIRFVTLGTTGASIVDFGMHKPSEWCLNRPGLLTCLQPMGDATGKTAPGVVVTPTFFPTTNTNGNYSYNSNTVHELADRLGSVFGIGVDPLPERRRSFSRPGNAFMGTFVKRHSEYGDAGATNTIYHVTVPQSGAGTVTPFITLPGTLPAHDATPAIGDLPYTGDTEIFPMVGRIGLGDVDVMDDGQTILAVDMDETAPKLYFVPIIDTDGTLTAGAPSSVAIPAPETFNTIPCPGIWHPMGIGHRGTRILVGGVCGAENTVTSSAPNGPNPTQSTAFVLEYSGAVDGSGSFSTIFAMRLNYNRPCVFDEGCSHSSSTVGSYLTADWGAWNEYPRFVETMQGSNPQAMLANIEITDTGDLILGFRDRYGDQSKSGSAAWSEAYKAGSLYPQPRDPYPA